VVPYAKHNLMTVNIINSFNLQHILKSHIALWSA
jgi:hypothetical protein